VAEPVSRTRQRLAALGSGAATGKPKPPQAPSRASLFPDWERHGEWVLVKRRFVELPDCVPSNLPPPGLFLKGAEHGTGDILFFDTETTGLGGTGAFIFLLGIARFVEGGLEAEQIFLLDFPGEREFLSLVRERFSAFRLFVSYNGKTFDSHMLRGRFLMNRMSFSMGDQIDLLHPARRIWRPLLGDCSLHSIEENVLGVERGLDIPGAEIPDVYHAFLRTGRTGRLSDVFEHNAEDVASLARLYRLMGRLLAGDLDAAPCDRRALGAMLLERGNPRGMEALEKAYGEGNAEAGRAVSIRHKRNGGWDRALEIWEGMAERKSLFAAMELAKYWEHKARDPQRALAWVARALSWGLPLDQETRRQIARRRERLEARIRDRGVPLSDRGIPLSDRGERVRSRNTKS